MKWNIYMYVFIKLPENENSCFLAPYNEHVISTNCPFMESTVL